MSANGNEVRAHAKRASDVLFFWTEGGIELRHHWDAYHWSADCPGVTVAAWHGARVYSSPAPPPNAASESVAYVRGLLEERLEGPVSPALAAWSSSEGTELSKLWLCAACNEFYPRPVAAPLRADDEPCAKCLCDREFHVSFRGPFDTGCSMCWYCYMYDHDGEVIGASPIHCPCTGYIPSAGGRPLTEADFAADRTWVPPSVRGRA